MHSKIVHKHMHRIVNYIQQLTNKTQLSGNLLSVITVDFFNWSITDEATTRNTTAYFFGPSCIHSQSCVGELLSYVELVNVIRVDIAAVCLLPRHQCRRHTSVYIRRSLAHSPRCSLSISIFLASARRQFTTSVSRVVTAV